MNVRGDFLGPPQVLLTEEPEKTSAAILASNILRDILPILKSMFFLYITGK